MENRNSLIGKTCVITGATSGIGLAVAKEMAWRGAFVIGIGRSEERCQAAENELRILCEDSEPVFFAADLSLQSSIREAGRKVREILTGRGLRALDGVLNNAGTFRFWLSFTPEGFETQWAVNHLAPFLMTNQLLPLLQAAPTSRVVTVSSGSHYGARLSWDDLQLRRRYNGLRAYGQTKLANVLFTAEMNRRLGSGSTVRAFAADPGLVKTDIGLKGTPSFVRWIWRGRRSAGIEPEEAALGIAFLLTEPSIQSSPDLYWLHGRPKNPSDYAANTVHARRLWDVSAQMCGLVQDLEVERSGAARGEGVPVLA